VHRSRDSQYGGLFESKIEQQTVPDTEYSDVFGAVLSLPQLARIKADKANKVINIDFMIFSYCIYKILQI